MEYAAAYTNLDGNWPAEKLADGTTFQTCAVPDYTKDNVLKRAGELPYFKMDKGLSS